MAKKIDRYKIRLEDLRNEASMNDSSWEPVYHVRDPGIEDSLAFEISGQLNPFWVNQREKPPIIWAWWGGRYRMLDLDT